MKRNKESYGKIEQSAMILCQRMIYKGKRGRNTMCTGKEVDIGTKNIYLYESLRKIFVCMWFLFLFSFRNLFSWKREVYVQKQTE